MAPRRMITHLERVYAFSMANSQNSARVLFYLLQSLDEEYLASGDRINAMVQASGFPISRVTQRKHINRFKSLGVLEEPVKGMYGFKEINPHRVVKNDDMGVSTYDIEVKL